jgi:hypothetical protein
MLATIGAVFGVFFIAHRRVVRETRRACHATRARAAAAAAAVERAETENENQIKYA